MCCLHMTSRTLDIQVEASIEVLLPCSVAPTAKTGSSGGWQPSVRSASDTPSSAGSIAISPGDVEICHHPDGRAWVLGAGNFGRVRSAHHKSHHIVSSTWRLLCSFLDVTSAD